MKRFLTVILFLTLVSPAWGQQLLKQSTVTTVNIGPFISDTDFKTLNSAITVTGMTIRLIKQSDTSGATSTSITPAASGSSNDCVAVTGTIGMYNCELTATDTNTLGRLDAVITVSGSLVVFHRFMVVGSTSYDSQVTSVASIDDLNETDCSTVANANSPMGKICANITGPTARAIVSSTATGGTILTLVDTARTEGDTDYWKGNYVVFTSGNISGQARLITAFDPANDRITFSPATTQAVSTQSYEIRASAAAATTGATDVNVISWAGTTVATPHTAGYPVVTIKDGTGTGELDTNAGGVSAVATLGTGAITTATFAAGAINAAAIGADAFTAAKFAADVSTEFSTTLMGTTVEGAETFKNFLRYGAAMLFNNYTSSGSTFQFKSLDGGKTRINYNTTATSRTIQGSRDGTD